VPGLIAGIASASPAGPERAALALRAPSPATATAPMSQIHKTSSRDEVRESAHAVRLDAVAGGWFADARASRRCGWRGGAQTVG